MCGRYGRSKISAQVKGKIPFFRAESALKPRYNIAPTQMAPVIVSQGEAVLKDMRSGLIPHQELAITSFLELPALLLQERGAKPLNGMLGAMQGNASGFSDRGQLPSAQQPQLQEKPR